MATRQQKMDAIALLKEDPSQSLRICSSVWQGARCVAQEKLAKADLRGNSRSTRLIEEEIFYPACTGQVKTPDRSRRPSRA
jgi:hypothetical protein